MTFDHLRYFAAAATYEHVSRAAKAVSISPSVISAAIASLEDELQCELFRRAGRRIELTENGRRLLEHSKRILASVDGLKISINGKAEELNGRYKLAASHFLTSQLLLPAWIDLQKKHPKAVGEIYSMNTAHAIADVIAGRLELIVCFSPLPHPDLREYRLGSGELVVVVRKKHPILKKTAKEQLAYLASAGAVIHKSTQGVDTCETHPIFDRLGFQPNIEIYFNDDAVAVQTVLNSDRWAFVPDTVSTAHSTELEIIKLPKSAGKAPYHISALWHRGRDYGSAYQQLFLHLQNDCKKLGLKTQNFIE